MWQCSFRCVFWRKLWPTHCYLTIFYQNRWTNQSKIFYGKVSNISVVMSKIHPHLRFDLSKKIFWWKEISYPVGGRIQESSLTPREVIWHPMVYDFRGCVIWWTLTIFLHFEASKNHLKLSKNNLFRDRQTRVPVNPVFVWSFPDFKNKNVKFCSLVTN